MKMLGNFLWLIFGGLESALGYFSGALALCVTIVGIPFGLQIFKIGLLCLWPFGSKVTDDDSSSGCICIPMNIIWIIFGGLYAFLVHVLFGVVLAITLVGIPFAKQHFKMARLSLAPFGKKIELGI